MPRNAPSGPVQPPSPNRTDLQTPPPPGIQPQGQPNGIPQNPSPPTQAVTVPTGLPYGENQALASSQSAVPLSAPGGPGAGPAVPSMSDALGAARQMQMPAGMSLTRPTERPNEPVHAGLPGSPVSAPAPRQVGNLSSMIAAVADASTSPALQALAARAAALGQ